MIKLRLRFSSLIVILIFLLLGGVNTYAQNRKIDSLFVVLKNNKEDTNKVRTLNLLSSEIRYSNPDTAIILGTEALQLAEKLNWSFGIAISNANLGGGNYLRGNYPKALNHYLKAIELFEKLNKKSKVADNYSNIGLIYDRQKDSEKALEYYFKALSIVEELHDSVRIAPKLGNIGWCYSNKGDFQLALVYDFRALKMNIDLKITRSISTVLANIGSVYSLKGDSALAAGNKKLAFTDFYPKSLDYYQRSLAIAQEIKNRAAMAYLFVDIGMSYVHLGKYAESEPYLLRASALADSLHSPDTFKDAEKGLSELYTLTNRHQQAFEYYKKYIASRDILFNSENTKKQTQIEMNFEFDKKQAADSILNSEQLKHEQLKHDQEIQQQRLYTLGGGIGFALMLIVAGVSIRAYRNKQKANDIISLQKALVEEKQKEILDSIHYAKRIQQSLLPTEKYIDSKLKRLSE